jgi:drug/metabolite transporter (DMT)-like permease
VLSRLSVEQGLTAADVTALRCLVAGTVLLPLALARRPRLVGELGWARAALLTVLAGAPYSIVLVGGSAYAPALHAAIVMPALTPVAAALLAFLVLGERPQPGRLAGLAVILCGIALFAYDGLRGVQPGAWRGDLLFVTAAVMWATFGLLSKRWKADPWPTTATICGLSLAIAAGLVAAEPDRLIATAPAVLVLHAAYHGLAIGILSLFLYLRAVACLGAATAPLFLALVPVTALLAGALILGERPTATEVAGMAVVIVGMVWAVRSTGRTA